MSSYVPPAWHAQPCPLDPAAFQPTALHRAPFPDHLRCRGFDYSGGAWNTLIGKPGSYLLYSDGAGVRFDAQIVSAAGNPKALFIQAVTLTRGALRTTATLSKVGAQWQTTGAASHNASDCCHTTPPKCLLLLHVGDMPAILAHSCAVMAMGKKVPAMPPTVLGNISVRVSGPVLPRLASARCELVCGQGCNAPTTGTPGATTAPVVFFK